MLRRSLARRFAHHTWAQSTLADALEVASRPDDPDDPGEPGKPEGQGPPDAVIATSCKTFAHVSATEWLWLRRIGHGTVEAAVWPNWSIEQVRGHIAPLDSAWKRVLEGFDTAEHARTVAYTNSKGETYRNSVADVLEHVLQHGAYHRGQIAAAIRASGLEPPYLDYIHAVRTDCIEPNAC